MLTVILSALISLFATFASSFCIDKLYKKFPAELSFPDEIIYRKRFRKMILFAGIFFCTNFLIKLPTPQNFYSITAVIFLLLITVTDLEQQIIFDKILITFALLGIISTYHLNLSLINHLIAAIIGGGIFLFIAILTNGIGGGDIKFIFVLGLWFGTDKLFSIVTTGMIFAGIAALILILLGKASRKDFFAYAPYFTLTTIYFEIFG